MAYWFWTILVTAVILWYVVVTIIVTVRGGKDVFNVQPMGHPFGRDLVT